MPNMTTKHALVAATAGTMMLGVTSLSAAPIQSDGTALKATDSNGVTRTHYRAQRIPRHHAARVKDEARLQNWNQNYSRAQNWNQNNWTRNWGPFGLPFAAAEGLAATTGAIVGGATAAVTGYPYGPYAYHNPYARDAYGSYAYAPGWGRDIGHAYYNGSAAPASQDNCAVDGGYGRKDYSMC